MSYDNFKDLINEIIKDLSGGDYSQAGERTTNLYMSICQGLIKNFDGVRDQIHNLLNEISELLDILLDLSDRLFGSSPLENEKRDFEKRDFKDQLTKASDVLNTGTVDAANRARELIEIATKEHQERMHLIETTGYYDPIAFCLFWKLWLLIDEMIQCSDFPRNKYEVFVTRLYCTISPALKSKQAIFSLAKHRNEIFPERIK